MKKVIEGFILAFQLLTTFPLKRQIPFQREQVRISVISYPIVGICIGFFSVGILLLMNIIHVSTAISALVIVTASIVFSGGLHLDGWMDCSDAFFSYKSKEEKLAIMKDSHIGAFAAISVIVLLIWKLVLVYEVLLLLQVSEYVLLVLLPFLTRMNVGFSLYFGKLAKQVGLAHTMKQYLERKDSSSYFIMLSFLAVIGGLCYEGLIGYGLALLASNFGFFFFSLFFANRAFGGMTGDTLGAAIEGGELWLWLTLYVILLIS